MPAKSKAQHRLMKACEHNPKACPPGLTPKEAKEYTKGQSAKSLPEKAKKKD